MYADFPPLFYICGLLDTLDSIQIGAECSSNHYGLEVSSQCFLIEN
jgi:hypothetical protein